MNFYKNIKIIEPKAWARAFGNTDRGNLNLSEVSADTFELTYFDIVKPEGHEFPAHFPQCCQYHKCVHQDINSWYEKFPKCCAHHKKLLEAHWFNKSDYNGVIRKVESQLSYTEYLINEKIKNVDWYEDITDYIEHNIASFGQLPTGYGSPVGLNGYLQHLLNWLKNLASDTYKLPPDKVKRIAEYIEDYQKPKGTVEVNLNALINTYKNWLKVFPFSTSYFKNLKPIYQKNIPILKGAPRTNRYSGVSKVKLSTQSDLIEFLVSITKKLLEQVDSTELVESGVLNDSKKHLIELVNAIHKTKQVQLTNKFMDEELKYIDILRQWLFNEKEYFEEIEAIIQFEQSPYTPKLQLPAIANEDTFEDFVCDLYNKLYPDHLYERFGKKGNSQKGIDIISTRSKVALQCKLKSKSRANVKSELKKDFKSDLIKSKDLKNIRIDHLIFASTYEDNVDLNEYIEGLKNDLQVSFSVQYIGWENLCAKVRNYPDLLRKYFFTTSL
ncbi:MAG: hypothetical protein AAF620_08605 [Bacteroidota bacterium]